MNKITYDVGDVVEMKKEHPCASRSKIFTIIRVGADIKIKCAGCGNLIMMSRYDFEKRLKKVVKKENQ